MRRILVGGSSGAGKTTLAKTLARRLEIPYAEVDSLFHGPGWVPRPEFVQDIDAFTRGDAWVIDHDYAAARHIVWPRLDTFVWGSSTPRSRLVARGFAATTGRYARRLPRSTS